MVKSRDEIIAQFHEQVNMTANELEAWLEDPKSSKAGTGVGIESGHKILEILRKNPEKDPKKYDDDDLKHMSKVIGYNKGHLAQEEHLKETKTREELENAKSTISLKNWGHDPVKTLDQDNDHDGTKANDATEEKSATNGDASSAKTTSKAAERNGDADKADSKKRKAGDASAETDEPETQTVEGVDGDEEGAEEEKDELEDDEQEHRPRKKSKKGGDA